MVTALPQCSTMCESEWVCVCVCGVCEEEKQQTLWLLILETSHCTHTSSISPSFHLPLIFNSSSAHLHLILLSSSSSSSTWPKGSFGDVLRTDDGGLSWLSLSSRLPYAVRGASIVFHSLSTLSPSGMTSSTHTLRLSSFTHFICLSPSLCPNTSSCLSLLFIIDSLTH